MRYKKILGIILLATMSIGTFIGCTANEGKTSGESVQVESGKNQSQGKKPKYIFTFIGDGMSQVQLNAARIFLGTNESKEIKTEKLTVDEFPIIGSATTQDSTSFAPDSASTATAIATGVKTHSGVIGLEKDKLTKPENLSEKFKKEGKKVGIVSSVSLDHATPAAFYAHNESRGNMYDISCQLANSNVDYFAGGSLAQPKGKKEDKEDVFKLIKEKGYKVTNSKEDFEKLNEDSNKVYAISDDLQDSSAMAYSIDRKKDGLNLEDFVKKGIDVLDNDKGFFMMIEGGKIDWAGHANDAMTNIEETIAFDKAVKVAYDFYKQHQDETLIIVTGDHETGGMTIGQATTGYNTAFDILDNQKMSFVEFNEILEKKKENKGLTLDSIMPIIKENFGLIKKDDKDAKNEENKKLVLSDYEYKKLQNAFDETMKEEDKREDSEESKVLYGGYEPLTVTLTHIINNKAGVGWTSYSHTGVPVPVYAIGQGSEKFNGSYDNTDIFKKIVEVSGIK